MLNGVRAGGGIYNSDTMTMRLENCNLVLATRITLRVGQGNRD
jgi:hypothetical protein